MWKWYGRRQSREEVTEGSAWKPARRVLEKRLHYKRQLASSDGRRASAEAKKGMGGCVGR